MTSEREKNQELQKDKNNDTKEKTDYTFMYDNNLNLELEDETKEYYEKIDPLSGNNLKYLPSRVGFQKIPECEEINLEQMISLAEQLENFRITITDFKISRTFPEKDIHHVDNQLTKINDVKAFINDNLTKLTIIETKYIDLRNDIKSITPNTKPKVINKLMFKLNKIFNRNVSDIICKFLKSDILSEGKYNRNIMYNLVYNLPYISSLYSPFDIETLNSSYKYEELNDIKQINKITFLAGIYGDYRTLDLLVRKYHIYLDAAIAVYGLLKFQSRKEILLDEYSIKPKDLTLKKMFIKKYKLSKINSLLMDYLNYAIENDMYKNRKHIVMLLNNSPKDLHSLTMILGNVESKLKSKKGNVVCDQYYSIRINIPY